MKMKNKKTLILLALIFIVSCIIPVLNSGYAYSKEIIMNNYISWIPSILNVFSAWLIFLMINGFSGANFDFHLHCSDDQKCSLKRFSFLILISMHLGLIATITIYYNFLTGVFFYFIMHIFLIIAYLSFINKDFLYTKKVGNRLFFFLYSLIWFIAVNILFYIFAYTGTESLVLLPYAYILGSMNAIAVLGLFYNQRPLLFRILIFTGSLIFMISDIFIVMTGNEMKSPTLYFINPTYVWAIFLILYSQTVYLIKKG